MPVRDRPSYGIALSPGMRAGSAARQVEALGFDIVATGEHVSFHGPVPNAFVTLAAAAGATERVRLLSAIALLPLYPAALAAKLVAELAFHSGERFELGVGLGGEHAPEFQACGVRVEDRVGRLEEGLEVISRLLTEPSVDFQGRFTTLEGISIEPRPTVPPRVWLGGRKPRAMERAGRYADVWMPYLYTPDRLAASLETVRGAAAERGRDPDAIEGAIFAWTCVADDDATAVDRAAAHLSRVYATDMRGAAERLVIAGTPETCAERVADFVAAGADSVIFSVIADGDEEQTEAWSALADALKVPSAGGVAHG